MPGYSLRCYKDHMNKKTLKITRGSLIAAIFGVLLFLNRQTMNIAEEFLVYAYPLPIMIFTAAYGLLSALPVFAVMIMLSFLMVTPYSALYALCYAAVGLAYGFCLHRKASSRVTTVFVLAATVLTNIAELLLISRLTGIRLDEEIISYREMLNQTFSAFPMAIPEYMLSDGYLKRMLIFSVTIFGVLQGFIIRLCGKLVYKRFRFRENLYQG